MVAPSICWRISLTVGICTLRRVRAVFGIRMSRTKRTSPFFLGMAIRGDNQGVAPWTFSMMPSLRISSSLELTFDFML